MEYFVFKKVIIIMQPAYNNASPVAANHNRRAQMIATA